MSRQKLNSDAPGNPCLPPPPRDGNEHALTSAAQIKLVGVLLAATLVLGVAAQAYQSRHSGAWARAGGSPSPQLRWVAPGGGPVHFSGQLDRASVLEGGDGLVKMELVIRGEEALALKARRVASDVLILLDRSGSMRGEPLNNAKAAIGELMSQLASGDRLALVSYASGASLDLPLESATADNRASWSRVVAQLQAVGGTNMSSGLDLADALLADSRRSARATRLILISDGHANEGDATFDGLRTRATRAVAREYVLSTVGVGQGFDEHLMTTLADAGTGNFYYVPRSHELGGVFSGEFASARNHLASGLAVRLAPGSGVEVVDAAGYPLERRGREIAFRPGALFAGQERRIWVTFRAPVRGEGEVTLAGIELDFRIGDANRTLAFETPPRIARVRDEDAYYADVDSESWSRALMVDDYNAMRQRVASAIQAGRESDARQDIEAYVGRASKVNAKLKRADVAAQIEEVAELEGKVREAFKASPAARNELSKGLTADARDERRKGSKAPPQTGPNTAGDSVAQQ